MNLALDIADDFRTITDWLRPVVVGQTAVNSALRRAVGIKEAASSDGKYLASDTVFHLDCGELTERPPIGESITDDDGVWTILECHWETLVNRWRCVCRRLSLEDGFGCSLGDYAEVAIDRATFAKSATGAMEPTWETLESNVPARVQLEKVDVTPDRSNRTTRTSAFVYFADNKDLRPSDRVIWRDTVLKVLSWDNFSVLDQLFRATCEVSRWPEA